MGFRCGGQQVMDGDVQEAHGWRAEVGFSPTWFLTAFVSLSLWPCRLSLFCHLCFATLSVYRDWLCPAYATHTTHNSCHRATLSAKTH